MKPADMPDIRALPLFKDMSEQTYEVLMRSAYVQTFPPQIELITEGDQSDFLHIVVEGSVELFASWSHRETTMATLRPIATFILAATIKDAPYLMSARTLEKSRIVLLRSTDVRDAFDNDNAFARAVVTELAAIYRSIVKQHKNIKLRTSLERLANYILRKREQFESDSFDIGMEKRRLASYLGMTPENLSRAIKALRPYGVTFDGGQVTVTNAHDLAGLAKPSLLIDDYTS